MLQNATTRSLILDELGCLLHNEVATMCSEKVNSVLKSKDLSLFAWSALIAELKKHAPMLYKLLSSCTKTTKDSTSIIGLCASVIFKFRHSSMSLVQWMLSTVLFAGRAKKEVSIILLSILLVFCCFVVGLPSASETSAVHVTPGNSCYNRKNLSC